MGESMKYEEVVVTPLMEQSNFEDADNAIYRVRLHFKMFDKSHLYGNVTYLKTQEMGEVFSYGALQDFISSLDEKDLSEIQNEIRNEIKREIACTNLIPLRQFVCDHCKQIAQVNESVLEYYYDVDYDTEGIDFVETITGLRIVHATNECTYSEDFGKTVGTVVSIGIFTGDEGFANLIALMEDEKASTVEVLEIIKRAHLPYYEEARLHKDKIDKASELLDWQMFKYQRENLREVVMAPVMELVDNESK